MSVQGSAVHVASPEGAVLLLFLNFHATSRSNRRYKKAFHQKNSNPCALLAAKPPFCRCGRYLCGNCRTMLRRTLLTSLGTALAGINYASGSCVTALRGSDKLLLVECYGLREDFIFIGVFNRSGPLEQEICVER